MVPKRERFIPGCIDEVYSIAHGSVKRVGCECQKFFRGGGRMKLSSV